MIQTGFVAQLHDLGLEIFHRRVGTAVLASSFCVRWSVHIGQQRHIFDPQTVDDDMNMDVAGLVIFGLVSKAPPLFYEGACEIPSILALLHLKIETIVPISGLVF